MTRAPAPPLPVVPGLKRCPFCGQTVTPPAAVVVHQCRGVILIIRLDVWQSRPIEDEYRSRIIELEKHPAARRRRKSAVPPDQPELLKTA